MKPIAWQKQGLIIRPEDGPAWRRHMSGAVHVVPIEAGYRVYLTGVGDDVYTHLGEPGRRRIGWLELDRDFNITRENPGNPVLLEGEPGAFDCDGVVMPMIVSLSERDLYMYYAGFGPGTGMWLDNHMGLAISNDGGDTWRRWSRAHLPVKDDRDPFSLGTLWAIRDAPDAWRIWYTAPRNLTLGDPHAYSWKWGINTHIRYATSTDGIHWDKPADNVVLDLDPHERMLTRPMIVPEPDGYRMWYSFMTHDTGYRIGYAESSDGLKFEKKPPGIDVSPEGWDSELIEYAFVLKEADRYLMFYNGNRYGGTGTGIAIGTTA